MVVSSAHTESRFAVSFPQDMVFSVSSRNSFLRSAGKGDDTVDRKITLVNPLPQTNTQSHLRRSQSPPPQQQNQQMHHPIPFRSKAIPKDDLIMVHCIASLDWRDICSNPSFDCMYDQRIASSPRFRLDERGEFV